MAMLHPDHLHDRPRAARPPVMLGVAVAALLHGGLVVWIARQTFTPTTLPPDDFAAVRMEVYRPLPPPEPPPEPTPAPQAAARPTLAPRTPATAPKVAETLPMAPADPAPTLVEGPPVVAPPATAPAKPGPPSAPEPVIRAPSLLSRPSAADLARFYPDRAQRLGVEGRTEMTCTVSSGGRAESCRLLSESPGEHGFGKAALELAKTFRFQPRTVDGKAVGGAEIRIPLRWTLAE